MGPNLQSAWIETGHQSGRESGREGEAKRSFVCGRSNKARFDQRLCDATGLPVIHTHKAWEIFSFELPIEENVIEDGFRLLVHSLQADFILGPAHDASAEVFGAHKAFHELDLIETNIEKEVGEFNKGFFGKGAAAVEIVPARQIARLKVSFVLFCIP